MKDPAIAAEKGTEPISWLLHTSRDKRDGTEPDVATGARTRRERKETDTQISTADATPLATPPVIFMANNVAEVQRHVNLKFRL